MLGAQLVASLNGVTVIDLNDLCGEPSARPHVVG